ncbi:DUF2304 domain-containing protein [uncultured Rothia sp.]|uniref:DUF2304 domain-containing protein n=1 Tax=uncultured Rothia sp. TaxID=316088 RepID=UPI003217223E
MPSNIFFFILALFIVVLVFAQVRNQKMKEKYAALWLVVSLAILVLALFPSLLGWLADITGVVVPVNLLFLLAIVMLIAVTLHLTLEISKLSDEARALAEEVAILRAHVEQGNASEYLGKAPSEDTTNQTTDQRSDSATGSVESK